jgi:predicted secreted hydrolase
MPVTGQAWFDKQWGDFLVYPQGGWDWFALQLDDGWDLMISIVRDATQQVVMAYGTLVDPAGQSTHLRAAEVHVKALGAWTSPRSGATYPSGWRIVVPQAGLDLQVTPVLEDQELVADDATGLTYWEGQSTVHGTRAGQPVRGLAYVELTGYAP